MALPFHLFVCLLSMDWYMRRRFDTYLSVICVRLNDSDLDIVSDFYALAALSSEY